MHNRKTDKVLKTFDAASNQGPARPRASIADIEVVAALFGRELCARLRGDEIAERAGRALELSALVAGLDPVGDFGT